MSIDSKFGMNNVSKMNKIGIDILSVCDVELEDERVLGSVIGLVNYLSGRCLGELNKEYSSFKEGNNCPDGKMYREFTYLLNNLDRETYRNVVDLSYDFAISSKPNPGFRAYNH